MTWIDKNCDGEGPHAGHESRVYPMRPSGNLILCRQCWRRENRYRGERVRQTQRPQDWPQENWRRSKVYASENENPKSTTALMLIGQGDYTREWPGKDGA